MNSLVRKRDYVYVNPLIDIGQYILQNLPPASCMVIIKLKEIKMNLNHPAKPVFLCADVEGGVDHGKKSEL